MPSRARTGRTTCRCSTTAYHIMAGLGTILAAVMGLSLLLLWRGRLFRTRWLLWLIMLSAPFPYIATTAGWMTAELGRQPWLVYGLLRTADGISPLVHSGNALFTLLGFLGLYLLLGLLFLFLMLETITTWAGSGRAPAGNPRRLRTDGLVSERRYAWKHFGMSAVTVMLAIYVVLDGFDFGVGILYPFVARTEQERRMALASIGPMFNGNEVWLIAAGGLLFFAFPKAYAAGFSGFYLALIIVLWLLMFRGLALELRSHLDHPLWRQLCDVTFSGASLLLAIVFGAALGNLIRGVPLNRDGYFFVALWTDFLTGPEPGHSGLVHRAHGARECRDPGLAWSQLSRDENEGRPLCAGRGRGKTDGLVGAWKCGAGQAWDHVRTAGSSAQLYRPSGGLYLSRRRGDRACRDARAATTAARRCSIHDLEPVHPCNARKCRLGLLSQHPDRDDGPGKQSHDLQRHRRTPTACKSGSCGLS